MLNTLNLASGMHIYIYILSGNAGGVMERAFILTCS